MFVPIIRLLSLINTSDDREAVSWKSQKVKNKNTYSSFQCLQTTLLFQQFRGIIIQKRAGILSEDECSTKFPPFYKSRANNAPLIVQYNAPLIVNMWTDGKSNFSPFFIINLDIFKNTWLAATKALTSVFAVYFAEIITFSHDQVIQLEISIYFKLNPLVLLWLQWLPARSAS